MTQVQKAETSADSSRVRARIQAEEVGGGVTTFCRYFLSEAHMNAEVAKRSAWSVMDYETVTL